MIEDEKVQPHCCRPGCVKPARWSVTPEKKEDPYDVTHACDSCLAWACESYSVTCAWFVIGPEPNTPGAARPIYEGPSFHPLSCMTAEERKPPHPRCPTILGPDHAPVPAPPVPDEIKRAFDEAERVERLDKCPGDHGK